MVNRFLIINFFSFIKRIFSIYPFFYSAIKFIPILFLFYRKISKKGTILFIIILIIMYLNIGKIELLFLPSLLIFVFLPLFYKVSYEYVLRKLIWFFYLSALYAIYQKFFGYTFIELNWIKSGVSIVSEKGLLFKDIRPFSFFSGIPEYTFFNVLYAYYFFINKKYKSLIFSIIMIVIAGSRGVMLSAIISFLFLIVFKKRYWYHMIIAFLFGLLIYIFLFFVLGNLLKEIESISESRILVFGTFAARVISALSYMSSLSNLDDILFGIKEYSDVKVFDNFYIFLHVKIGLLGLIIFYGFFLKKRYSRKEFFFTIIFYIYSFYADVLMSMYFSFLLFFAIYSKGKDELGKNINFIKNNKFI